MSGQVGMALRLQERTLLEFRRVFEGSLPGDGFLEKVQSLLLFILSIWEFITYGLESTDGIRMSVIFTLKINGHLATLFLFEIIFNYLLDNSL
jgi:hypothetical protein